jgi:hypothetical protein
VGVTLSVVLVVMIDPYDAFAGLRTIFLSIRLSGFAQDLAETKKHDLRHCNHMLY